MNRGSRLSVPRILLVEADEDHRRLLAEALARQGYSVDQAASAQEGQDLLAHGSYGLVITHYGLPGRTGADLLRDAKAAGHLADTAAIVFTGRRDIDEVSGFDVVRKPIDFGDLLRQVERVLGAPGRPAPDQPREREAGAKVELILYVTMPWPSSHRASRNVQEVLGTVPTGDVALTVYDLALEPGRAEQDKIVFSPTLVKVRPAPRMWVLGDLADRDVLVDLLATCGVEVHRAPKGSRSRSSPPGR